MRPLESFSFSSRSAFRLVLCAGASLVFFSRVAVAQEAASPAGEPPLVTLDTQAAGVATPPDVPPAATPAPAAPVEAAAPPIASVSELTRQLVELEARTMQLEAARDAIRTRGPRIGKIVSWTMTAVFLGTAFSWFGRAEAVNEALKDGRTDKAYDVNGNGKVTQHDEDLARRVARTFAITSLIPIGLGVFSTLLEVRRNREKRGLTHELEDVALSRRNLLRRLETQVSASKTHAALSLRLAF